MGQPIIQSFVTTADDSGAKKISASLKTMQKDLKDTEVISEATGKSMDVLGGRSERLAAKFVLKDIALQATGAASAITSTTQATESAFVGLELLGRAALGFSGEVGLVILGITAFIEIIMKLTNASKITAEEIEKDTSKLRAEADQIKINIPLLEKMHFITQDEAKVLREKATLDEKEIQNIKAKVEARETLLKSQIAEREETIKANGFTSQGIGSEYVSGLIQRQKELTEIINAKRGFIKEAEKVEQAENIQLDRQTALNKILIDQAVEKQKKAHAFIDLANAEKTAQEEVNDTQTAYVKALQVGDKATIESAQKRMEAAKQERAAIHAAVQSMVDDQKKLASEIMKGASLISGAWENQNGKILFSTQKLAAGVIQLIAQQIETELAMAAARDFLSGNFVKGAAEAAGVGVVAGLAGAAGAALGGSAPSASVSAPSGGSSANAQSSGGSNTYTNLMVEIRGGYFDESAADKLAKMLSKRVQQGNVRLISSAVNPSFGQVPS